MTEIVRVEGLAELRRALNEFERIEDLAELKAGLLEAARIVAVQASANAREFSNRAAETIRPGTSGPRATVTGGKSSLPWYGWADFGSRTPRQGQPRSVGPWSKSGKGPTRGRFIYPALDEKEDEVRAAVDKAIDNISGGLGF